MLEPGKQLGWAIRSLREEQKLSQEKLAVRANLQRSYLSEIERGARNPNIETLVRVAQALSLRASHLIAKAEKFVGDEVEKNEEHVIIDELKAQLAHLSRRLRVQRRITGSISFSPSHLPKHSHICSLYSDSNEQMQTLVPIFHSGLTSNSRCIYIADETPASVFLDALRSHDFDLLPYLRSGALVLLNKYDTYLCGGQFSKSSSINNFKSLAEETIAAGYSGLRVAAEMTWSLSADQDSAELFAYERLVQELIPEFDLVGICMYNRKRFTTEVLREMIYAHPLLADNGNVMTNCFFTAQNEETPDEVEMLFEINRMCIGLSA